MEGFDQEIFNAIVDYVIVGGYDENGVIDPYLIRFILKREFDLSVPKDVLDEVVIQNNKIDLNKYDKNIISFVVSCSKGTYIRSLCEDIAEKLNTLGYMKNLKRLQVGKFNIKDAVYIDDIDLKNVNDYLITLEEILRGIPCINLDEKKLKLFLNGVQLTDNNIDGLYKIYVANKFIGTGTIKKGLLKRDIIL